jgi:PQQ-dependent catabolism-associated CXXCW motif protein
MIWMMRLSAIFFSLTASAALSGQIASTPEPAGYRLESYRAPTPATLEGARVLNTTETHEIWKNKQAVFIDVLPRAPRPQGLPANAVWRESERKDIPGSIWLPDTGYGVIADVVLRYFQRGLIEATEGNKNRSLVFYCQKDCWMSWNAAKRALSLGYRDVSWYPEGSDGWAAAAYPLETQRPKPHTESIYRSP